MCSCYYNWPSVSVGSASMDSTNCRWKIIWKKYYPVVDMHYVIMPVMAASLLNI